MSTGPTPLEMSQETKMDLPPTERLDALAKEAVTTVFDSMIGESLAFKELSCLLADCDGDMLARLPLASGIYSIVVSWLGDAGGKVTLMLPKAAAERFALKLFDLPSVDWLEGDSEEVLSDTLGELGNMLVGLVKGGLTKWYPSLMLTTPKVLKNRRMKVDTEALAFRRQYLFEGLGGLVLVDFCCE